jgi:hypothetical protein
MDVKDTMPRSVLTPAQQRRLAALQAAQGILRYTAPVIVDEVDNLLVVARYVETGA